MKRVKDNLFHPLGRPAIAGLFLYLSGKFPWEKPAGPFPLRQASFFQPAKEKIQEVGRRQA